MLAPFETTTEPATGAEAALRWTVHPAAAQPLRTLAILATLGLASVLVYSVSGSVGSASLAALLLFGSLRAWFLPRTYELDAMGAMEHGPLQAPRRLAWTELRAVTQERHGVHLSPLHRPSRWVRDRGLFLRTDQRSELAAQVSTYIRNRRVA